MTETPAASSLGRIQHVTVLGAGTMGSQIAMVSALAGFSTTCVDIAAEPLERARQELWRRVDRDVEKGRRTAEDVAAAKERLSFSTDRDAVVAHTDLVIEAAVENLEVKREIFASMDQVAPEHTILTTNSSNIVSSKVADATGRPEKVCNMHFFNPALVMQAVEVVPNGQTSAQTVATVKALAEAFGKTVVELKREIPGFVANRMVAALRKEALDLLDAGVADVESIDAAAKAALNHPMGPFELMDLVGIDVAYLIRQAEYEQTGDEASLPHPLLKAKYESGDYGRKTGKGWYTYSED
ncbi:3-hydroxyacyl-CoA dehydrogenase family protein [Micrococcus sp.]|uniref:3-hydroxyacyl-CoA dehydrogenase family protein n=1 Tax=Micrococcus sp. TaxID=1271 RepID=UPI002A90B6FA|nr:3-hydroxyacyl-CoA dehydrogenase family protein [Micrococcus sp.]MDY6055964.1 3-hydroxyacyl-CoA dehydrogenase family protein [Micrococcus sp.]